jgi:hypothetical protein
LGVEVENCAVEEIEMGNGRAKAGARKRGTVVVFDGMRKGLVSDAMTRDSRPQNRVDDNAM